MVVLTQLIARRPLARLKFTAAVSIAVTFLVYLLILAPLMSGCLIDAYAQDHCASLFLHLITPLLTLADFIINDAPARRWRCSDALWATLPPIIWFGFILVLGTKGVRWHDGMAAPYMFLNYESPAGWFGWKPNTISMTSPGIGVFYVILLMTLIFIGIGLVLIRISKKQLHD
jgi:hypothetical protein